MNAFGVNLPEKEQKRITPSMFSLPGANNNNIQTPAVAQPKQTQPKTNWYSGSQPTASETIAQIYKVGKDNPDMLSQLNDMFNAEIMNPESNLYQPYLMPTTDKVNDTNIRNTNNATNEWNQLQAELAYWANRADRNYSDDEIINRIDMTKYPTLAKMDAYKTTGVTMDLLAPVGYSKDAMYGVLWSARNGGQTSGNYLVDAAQGIMGNGNKYQRDEALYGRRDATSDNYAPYTVGATALDDLSYKYGMQGDFTEDWLNGEGRVLLNGDEQSRKDYNRIYNTVMNTNKLDEQAAKFNADVEKAIAAGIDPEVFFKPETIEEYYPELAKALEGQRGGKLYETSRAVNFDYNEAVRDMKANFDKLHGTKSDEEFESEIGTSTGSEFFGNEADQLTNQIKWLDTNVNLPDFVPLASGREIDSMRLRASATYGDVSSWVGNSIVNGTGGEEQGKAALQIATHDYANRNLFSAWDTINNNYLTFEGQMSEETKAFLQQNFPDKFAAGQLPTEADFEQFMSSRVAGIDPDEMQLDWNSRIQDFAPGTTFDDLKYSGGDKFLQKYMPDWYERKEVPSIEEVENAIAMARSDKDFMNQWEAVRADAEIVDLEIKARQQAADEAAVEVEDIYDDFAELYGEGTEQYKAAINTYQMAYPYTKGVPKEWAAYDPYQYASQAEGVTNDQLAKFYVNTKGNIGRQILQLSGLIENANTIGLPADVVENMEQHLLDLQNTIERLERHTLKDKEDYSNQIAAFDAQFPVEDWSLSSMVAPTNPNHSEVVRRAVVDPKNAIAWGAAETDRGDTVEVAQYMTDEERDNYKYIYMTEGEEAATAYFDLLYENLRVRATETLSEEIREWSSQNALTATVATAASVPLTLFEAAEGGYAFLSTLRGDEYNPYQFQAGRLKGSLREGSKDFIGDSLESAFGEYGKTTASVIKVLYDGVMGAVDSGLTMKFGPVGTSVIMGLGGFNSAMMDASERGASEKEAFVYALCSAVIEGATERITFKRLTEALKGGKEGTKSFLKTILSGFGSEASEEIISAVLTNIADEEIMEALSQHSILVDQYMNVAKLTREEAEEQAAKDIAEGIMYQGLIGGFSGAFSSGFQYGKGYLIQKFDQGQGTNITGGAGSAVATEGNVSVDSSVDAQTPQLAAPTEGTENNSNKAGGNIARAASALATAMQDGTSASQQTATVEGVLRSFGLDEMEASAAAKNIVSSGNLRVLRKLMSKTTNPEMLVKAISMGSVVDTSTCAVILNTRITSKNAYSVAGKLIAAYEADVQNKRFTDSYDAHVIFSAEADAIAEHIKSNGTLDHTAVDNANAKAKEADSKFEAAKQEEEAAHQAVLDANARFNQNPSDPQAKAAVKAAINNQYTARKNRASAENDANVAHKNLETEREKLKKQAEDFMVIARGEAKTQVAEQVQHKREVQEANAKKEAEASTANDNAVQATNETVVNEVPAVSEAETAAKTKLDEAQQKFDEAKGKEVEAARNLGNAVAKYNENTSDPQAKAEIEAAMKVLDNANAESVAAEEALKNAKAEHDSVSKQNNQPPVNQNIQQKAPSAPVVAQNPQSVTPSAEQAVGNESGVVDKQGKPRIRYSRGTDSQSFSGTRNDGTVVNPIDSAKKLSSALGIGEFIGTRKMNGLPKAVLGYYNEYSKHLAVRSTEASSIRTTMHEVGHAISQKLNLTGTDFMVRNLPEAFKANYSEYLLPGEAFAEFVWRYMANDAQAEAFAGAGFVHQFEQSLRNAGIADAVHTARNEIRSFINADVNAKIGSTIVDRSEKTPSDIKDFLIAADASLTDSTAPLETIDKDIRGRNNGKLSSAESLRDVALLRNTADKRASSLLTSKMTDSHWNVIGDSLATVIQKTGMKGKDFDLLNRYMLALHSMDRDAQGLAVFDSSISSEDRSRFISEVESNNPEVAKAAEAITNWWYNFMQTFMVDTGYLTQDTLDLFKRMYPHYVPTNRVKNKGVNRNADGRNTYTVKRATGSTEKIYNPIDTIVQNVHKIVNMVSQNNVAVVFDNLYGKYEGLGIFARNVTQDVKKDTVSTKELKEKVEKILKDKFFDTDATEKILALIGDEQTQWKQTGDVNLPNVLKVQRPDGGVAFYQFADNEIYKAVSGLSEKNAHGFWDFFGRMTNGMAALTTGSNPLFSVRNFMRDFQKSVNYGTWAKTYADGLVKWMRSAYEVWREGGEYKQYKALGGGGWTRIDANTKKGAYEYRSDLFKGYNTSNVGRTAKWVGQKLWNTVTLSRLNEIVEQASRYAEYRFGSHDLSTESGRQEAFLAAQEATVDFSRSGNSQVVRDLKKIIPFFNASVQGVYQTGREFFSEKERGRLPARFAKTVLNTAFVSALASGLMLKFMDEEDKEEFFWLSDDLKSEHFYIPNPFGDNPPLIRIPLPQDALSRAVHGFVTNMMWNGKNADEPAIELAAIVNNIIDGFNPASSTIFDPLIAFSTNKNWYGSNIVPARLENVSTVNQYTEETPEIFIALGQMLGVSPMKLQYAAEQYTGFLGQIVIPALSKDKYTGEVQGISAAFAEAKKKLTSDPLISNDVVNSFYDSLDVFTNIQYDAKRGKGQYWLNRSLSEQEAIAAVDEVNAMLKKGGILKDTQTIIAEMYDRIEEIEASLELTDHEKYVQTSAIRREMIENVLSANEEIAAFKEKYINGTNLFTRMFVPGKESRESTAYELLPETFRNDFENGSIYMTRSREVWEATGTDSALPKVNFSFDSDNVHYDVPDELQDEYAAEYKATYERIVAFIDGWDEMTNDERLKALKSAHTKAHNAAKKWYLNYLKENREW